MWCGELLSIPLAFMIYSIFLSWVAPDESVDLTITFIKFYSGVIYSLGSRTYSQKTQLKILPSFLFSQWVIFAGTHDFPWSKDTSTLATG